MQKYFHFFPIKIWRTLGGLNLYVNIIDLTVQQTVLFTNLSKCTWRYAQDSNLQVITTNGFQDHLTTNYHSISWSSMKDLNLQSLHPKCSALPNQANTRWCSQQDLNLYAFLHRILSPTCLPVSSWEHGVIYQNRTDTNSLEGCSSTFKLIPHG